MNDDDRSTSMRRWRIHRRVGGRSARRDQPAPAAHALERLCEARRTALAGTLAARYASSEDLRPVLLAGRSMRRSSRANRRRGRCRHSRAGAREQARAALRQTTDRTHLEADRRGRFLAGERRARGLLHPRAARRLDAHRRAARQRRRVRRQSVHAAALRRPDAEAHPQGFAAWDSSRASVAHSPRTMSRGSKPTASNVVDGAVAAARDPARGRRAAGIAGLGRGDDSRQHHPRHERLAAGAVGEGVDPNKFAPH